ncbi:MAG: protein kinase domain-containing protein, partial [Gemmataceae bacterium]
VALPDAAAGPKTRLLILAELRDARKNNLLCPEPDPKRVAEAVGAMARFTDPQAVLARETGQLRDMGTALRQAGYDNLGWLMTLPAHASESLLVVAARFFFRRELERDDRLIQGLQLAATESLAASQRAAFRDLDDALAEHGTRVEQAFVAMQAQLLAAVGRVGMQVAEQGEKLDDLRAMQAQVLDLVKRLDLQHQPLKPGHSLSLHSDRERQLVKELLARFRAMPARQQDANPELISDLGKLLVAAGDFGGARESFARAAALAPGDAARAEAHYNSYRAALEQADNDAALRELLQAMAIDPARFAPFPLDKYEAEKILGAGGFGVTFLCRHKLSRGQVALKALFAEELDRDVGKVLEEASTLDALKHRSIVALRDCGYAGPGYGRPYLVMEYFPGATLEDHVKASGPLPFDAARELAVAVAEALEAAHGMNVLHRDIKPANLLLRPAGGGFDVRVIDFGLALKHERLENVSSTLRNGRTILGSAIAGTLGYAAPEQMGKLPGVRVGPPADVYGFGRTMAFALFGVPEPTLQHYRKLPEEFADLLGRCLSQDPKERPRDFREVLGVLKRSPATTPAPSVPAARAVLVGEERTRPVRAALVEEEPRRRRDYDEDDRRPRRYDDVEEVRPRRRDDEPGATTAARVTGAVLALLFGYLGVHKFVQGNTTGGLIRLGVTLTCVGFYANAVIQFIEAIMYLAMSNEDYHRRYVRERRVWF